jgi:fucose 4-O-acetylase-like acetyltransferase
VFLLPSLLRPVLGYPAEVFAVSLSDSPWELVTAAPRIVHQWFLSGWFPLLPWLGFSFLGAWLYRWRQMGVAAVPLIAIGLAAAWLYPPEFVERGSYTELFYPASLAYLLVAAGTVLALLPLTGQSWLKDNQPLVQLGRCPLLMYLVHLAILRWALHPLVGEVELPTYLLLYAALLLILVGLAGAVAVRKQRSSRRLPLPLRLLLGS